MVFVQNSTFELAWYYRGRFPGCYYRIDFQDVITKAGRLRKKILYSRKNSIYHQKSHIP